QREGFCCGRHVSRAIARRVGDRGRSQCCRRRRPIPRAKAVNRQSHRASYTWVGGWAIAPDSVLKMAHRLLPNAFHRVLPPTQWALKDLGSSDILVGYSFGAHLLMRASEELPPKTQLVLLAPF